MFLLPLFPDDILCFVTGLSTMSWRYFIVMQLIARAISVVTTSYGRRKHNSLYDLVGHIDLDFNRHCHHRIVYSAV